MVILMLVVGSGDLDVLTISLYECDGIAIALYHRGIIGKAVVIGLTVGSLDLRSSLLSLGRTQVHLVLRSLIRSLQQLDIEGLWGLHQAVIIPRHSL